MDTAVKHRFQHPVSSREARGCGEPRRGDDGVSDPAIRRGAPTQAQPSIGTRSRNKDAEADAKQRALMERLFGTIAGRYDRFNAIVSASLDRRWRARAIAQALGEHPLPQARVLDLCTGTGDIALEFTRHLNGRSRIVGLDVSEPMLRLARQKAQRLGAQVEWLRGDALHLPFPDCSFDCVTIGFSTRNVPDLRAACEEMCRVLRPQGRLVILEAGKPQSRWIQAGYYTYLYTVMPLIGFLVCGALWPFQYLRRSIATFLTPPAFSALLRDVGFASVAHLPCHGGIADLFVAVRP